MIALPYSSCSSGGGVSSAVTRKPSSSATMSRLVQSTQHNLSCHTDSTPHWGQVHLHEPGLGKRCKYFLEGTSQRINVTGEHEPAVRCHQASRESWETQQH
jgi:hypothetical protein